MKHLYLYLAILFFAFVTALFFYQVFLQGKVPVAADAIVGLYHPYRDFYASNYPNGIPFKNFLVTDPVRQQYPWRFLAIEEIKNFNLPLWNPYNGAGMPLLANFQTAAFYPLNIIFILFPFITSWSILIILQIFLASLFMYLYLRHLRLHALACVLGALTFSLSGFSIAWLEWNTILQTVMWVPLLLLAKDHYLRDEKLRWIGVLIFSESSLLLAGHLQTAFYCLVIVNLYLFARIYQIVKVEAQTHPFRRCFKLLKPFVVIGLVVAVITSIQWLPTLQLIINSARQADQVDWQAAGWFMPWQNLIQFFVPDFFGNPATLNYWGVWNYGELVGYVGIVPLIMVFLSLFFRRDKKTAFFGSLFFLSLFFSLPTIFAKLPYLFSIPYLSSSQPTRLLSIVDFSLAILAALGFDLYIKRKKGVLYPIFFIALCFISIWIVAWIIFGLFGMTLDQALIARSNLKLPTFIFVISSVLLSLSIFFKGKKLQKGIIIILVLISLLDLLRFGWKFTPFTNKEYLYPQTKTLAFLHKDPSVFRIMTTDSRILPPNFSIMYALESIDLYDPLYLRRYGELIAAMERGEPNINPPFGFNRIITPHAISSSFLNLLNVKYILSLSDISSTRFRKVFSEGNTKIFENKENLPRAFFVKKIVSADNTQDAIEKLFKYSSNLSEIAVVEGLRGEDLDFSKGEVVFESYNPNRIILKTKNSSAGFLVLTDAFFPSWKATIVSGSERSLVKIYMSDFVFRGIFIPAGEHKIIFSQDLM